VRIANGNKCSGGSAMLEQQHLLTGAPKVSQKQ